MRNHVALLTLFGVQLLAPGIARADNPAASGGRQTAVEVTPYVSLGSAATSGLGAAVRWPSAAHLSLELEVSQRYAEINALGSSLNLLFDLPSVGRLTPYVAGGIGLEQFGYATGTGSGSAPIVRSGTAVTVNAGGGVRVPVDHTWGVRSDMRWFNGLGQAPERWRLYNGLTFGRSR
jgi:hypothetical protein